MSRVVFRCVWFYSLCVLALANLQFLHPYSVLIGVANIRHQESIYSSAPDKESVHSGASDNIRNCNTDCHPRYKYKPLKSSLQNTFKARLELHPPRIASSSAMSKFFLHFSCYSIALNLIFPAFTLSPTFSNFRSSLHQMEPTPSQVRNHYSQKNPEAHLERALAFKKAANLHCLSNVCLPIICLRASCCG